MITKELLEELEKLEDNNAVAAVMHHFDPAPVAHKGWVGLCPECKYALSPASKYCPRCGKAVKWE